MVATAGPVAASAAGGAIGPPRTRVRSSILLVLAIAGIGYLLFALCLTGVIPTLVLPAASPPPQFDVLTGIGVFYVYHGIAPLFGPNTSRACLQCPITFQAGTLAQFYFAWLNTTGATATVMVNLTEYSQMVAFSSRIPGGQASHWENTTLIYPKDRLFQVGADLSLPEEGQYVDFAIQAFIDVEYCGPPYCTAT
jgi:hypothetical protein